MKRIFNKKIGKIFLFLAFLGVGFFLLHLNFKDSQKVENVMAGAGDNVSGFAWSSSTAWISFNSTDCDTNKNGFIDTNGIRNGCNGNDNASTPSFDYGVRISLTTGEFTGRAWSSSLGWISFNRTDFGVGDPPAAPFNGGSGQIANYNSATGEITGWAKILSISGTRGWLRFYDTSLGASNSNKARIENGYLKGWLWHGGNTNEINTTFGWFSLNSENCPNNGAIYTTPGAGYTDCPANNTPYRAFAVYAALNSAPTVANLFALQKTDGSGAVDITFQASDIDQDNLRAKLIYRNGASCNNNNLNDPFINTLDASTTADYGDPKIDNNIEYQVGTASGWILTQNAGVAVTNNVFTDWLTKPDLSAADGTYCLWAVLNDMDLSHFATSTYVLTIDNVNPNIPGNLTIGSRTGSSITLNFGTPSADTHFNEYKIFYLMGNAMPTEENTSVNDTDLTNVNFNDTDSTIVTGLNLHQIYSFVIYAYDTYGNKSRSANYVATTTNNIPVAQINSPDDDVIFDTANACNHVLIETLRWTFSDAGDSQSAYQIQVKTQAGNWGSPYLDLTFNPFNNELMSFSDASPYNLQYNTTYNYRVKVRDSYGDWSAWSISIGTFSTPVHRYPYAYFDYLPHNFSINEPVSFFDNPLNHSKYFDNGNIMRNCTDATCNWYWSTTSPATIANRTASTTNIIFNTNVAGQVQLDITDKDHPYTCSTTSDFTTKKKLPSWIETK
jgi:chitodextrinase